MCGRIIRMGSRALSIKRAPDSRKRTRDCETRIKNSIISPFVPCNFEIIVRMECDRTMISAGQKSFREKRSTVFIKKLEKRVKEELFPAALGLCRRVENYADDTYKQYTMEYIRKNCPIQHCVLLEKINQSNCPNHLCIIAEGSTPLESLPIEIYNAYSLMSDAYIDALDVPDNPDEEITFKKDPIKSMNRMLTSKDGQNLIINTFKKTKLFKPRLRIIKDIFWAYEKNRYNLSVPLLIIQIEGVLHDIAYKYRWKFNKNDTYHEESVKIQAIIKKLDDRAIETALHDFYTRLPNSEDSPRNLILHGRSVDYGANHRLSTVLFLILIYIVFFYQMNKVPKTAGAPTRTRS